MPLLDFLQSSPETVRAMSIEQIVKTAGEGKLRDGSEAQSELREFLRQVSLADLERYADYCLTTPFDKTGSGYALQDIVNELGRRLEYDVTNGRYQGVVNDIGHDGLWRDPSGRAIVIEVKTTDAYRMPLDVQAGYVKQLRADGTVDGTCSILIVVGRWDTGELEAQVRGSRHAWDIRIIGLDALVRLVHVKQSADTQATVHTVRQLLTPLEFTRLDRLVDAVFTTAHDVEDSVIAELPDEAGLEAESGETVHGQWEFTPKEIVHELREKAVQALGEKLGVTLQKKSRAQYWDHLHTTRVACAVSKRHSGQGTRRYWYAYRTQWHEFLSEGQSAYLLLACVGLDKAFAVPADVMAASLPSLGMTKRESGEEYYHVKVSEPVAGDYQLELTGGAPSIPLEPYSLPLL